MLKENMLKKLFKTPAFRALAVAFGVIAALGAGKVLYGESLRLGSQVTFQQGTVDPTVTAVSAGAGSIYINTSTGDMYQKTDSGSSTNWRMIGVSAANTAPVAFTPAIGAGAGTVTNNSAFYQQIGNNLRVYGSFTTGTVAGSLVSIGLPGSLTLDTSRISIANTTSNPGMSVGRYTQNGGSGNFNGPIVTATGTSTSFVYFGANDSAATNLTPANGSAALTSSNSVSYDFIVPVSGLASVVNTAQSAIITDWASYSPAPVGFGTPTISSAYWRRVGNTVEIQARWTTGTTTGAEAQWPLPGGCVSESNYGTTEVAGTLAQGTASVAIRMPLIEPNVSYLTFGYQDSGNASLTKILGSAFSNSTAYSFQAKVRCAGWGGTIPAPSILNEFSWKISAAGTVSNELSNYGGDPVSGNCALTDTSLYTCTLTPSFCSAAPNCSVTPVSTTDGREAHFEAEPTSSSVAVRTDSGGGTKVAMATNVRCQCPR